MSKIRIINTVCLNFVKLRVFTLDAVLILSFLVFLVFPFIRVCDRLSAFVSDSDSLVSDSDSLVSDSVFGV